MRAGAASGHDGYFHEVAVYSSDEELVGLVVAHLREGAAAGEPTFVALHEREAALVRAALPDPTGITFLAPLSSHTRPPAAIRELTAQLRRLVAGGARQVRAVNTVPHPGLGTPWEGWCRYEAAVNELLADIPVWGLCLYDRRLAPDEVIEDALRTHPFRVSPGGDHVANPAYEDPVAFLRSRGPSPPDPLEAGRPALDLVEPSARDGRGAVGELAKAIGLGAEAVADLVLATSEAVTNAGLHGRGRVQLKAWTDGRERVVVTVSDEGQGPDDALVGLAPRGSWAGGEGGLGLWLSNQLVEVTHERGPDGYTVRLAAGRPTDPPPG